MRTNLGVPRIKMLPVTLLMSLLCAGTLNAQTDLPVYRAESSHSRTRSGPLAQECPAASRLHDYRPVHGNPYNRSDRQG
jgi:hypothetical protein